MSTDATQDLYKRVFDLISTKIQLTILFRPVNGLRVFKKIQYDLIERSRILDV